jgi:hypothetical protein
LHCIQSRINRRHFQNKSGQNSPKTTDINTKTIEISNKKIISPSDNLIKKNNLGGRN